jgi:hypothetical protein
VSGSAATGTKESYTAQIGGQDLLTIYGEANGYTGGIKNYGVGIGSTTPWGFLSVAASSTGPALVVSQGTTSASRFGSLAAFFASTTKMAELYLDGRFAAQTFTASSTNATSSFAGFLEAARLNITGSATNTSSIGFNITSGCYAINGVCVSGGGVAGSNTNDWIVHLKRWGSITKCAEDETGRNSVKA